MSDVGQQINLQEQNTMKSKACFKYEIWHLSVFPLVFFLTEKWQGLIALIGLAQSAERLKALHQVLRMLGF